MAEYTEHYNLKKPLKSENYDVDVANTNNDIIDEKIFGKVDKIVGKSLSSNDFTDGYKQKVDKLIEGTKGDSAYQVALKNGFEGTETQWLASLKGDKGDTGDVSKEELKEVTENKRLKLEGKSEQAVRSGKNKLKITNFTDRTTDGVTFTAKFSNNKELEYIEAKGNSTTGYKDIIRVDISSLPAGNYIINGLGTNKVIRYVLLKQGDTDAKIINTNTDVAFTQDSSSPYVAFRIDLCQAGEIDCQIKPMIRQASITDNTYEPYGVSPSPDYHSRIRNIGDNVNLAEYVEGLWLNSVSLKFTNSENTYGFIAKVKPNTQYIINKKYAGNRFIVVSSSIYPQKDADVVRNIFTPNHNLTQYTFTTQSNEKYIFLGVYYKTDFETEEEELKKAIAEVKIEESSIATPYTEYGYGSIDYLARNKNLAFLEFSNKVRGYGNGNLTNSDIYDTYKAIVEENTKYTVSFVGNDNNVSNLCYFDKNMDYIKGEPFNTGNPRILTTPENCKYITLAVNHDITNFMIEKGKINTGFIEHQEKNIHIPLNKGQVIHKDDYIMNNEIHQNRKTIILVGTENWVLSNNYTNNSRFSLILNDIKIDAKVLSSHFKEGVGGTDTENIDAAGNNQRLMITIRNSIATTVAQLKEYLAEQYANDTPVTVEYELAEEIVTPLTKEQIEAFYEQQKAKYVDKMTLTCLNEIEPTLTDIDKSLEESLLDVEKLLAMLSLNS